MVRWLGSWSNERGRQPQDQRTTVTPAALPWALGCTARGWGRWFGGSPGVSQEFLLAARRCSDPHPPRENSKLGGFRRLAPFLTPGNDSSWTSYRSWRGVKGSSNETTSAPLGMGWSGPVLCVRLGAAGGDSGGKAQVRVTKLAF